MACGCGKLNIALTKKTDLNWTVERAEQISRLRETDVQIFMRIIEEGTEDEIVLYEIEFPLNPSRGNIIKIIKYIK